MLTCRVHWGDYLKSRALMEHGMKENLSEEKETDVRLTQLAESHRNLFAHQNDTEKKEGLFSKLTR
jgi:hypothetical protein